MKKIKLKISIYDWRLMVVVASKKDIQSLKKVLESFPADNEDIEYILESTKEGSWGGNYFHNVPERKSLVITYNCKTIKRMSDVLPHELNHVVERMTEFWAVKDVESKAMLTGYISKKILPRIFSMKS